VTVKPGCRTSSVKSRSEGPAGVCYRVELAAEPVEGRANSELVRFLSGEFGVKADSVEIRSGRASRRKLVRITGPSRMPAWFAG